MDLLIKGGFSVRKIILAFLLIFCFAYTASAANFVEIIRDDNFLIYIDVDSLQDKGDYLTCWTKWIPRGKELERYNKMTKKKVSHLMGFDAYKVNDHQSQRLAEYYYYKNGEHEKNFAWNLTSNGWEELVPQSYGEFIWGRVKAIAGY